MEEQKVPQPNQYATASVNLLDLTIDEDGQNTAGENP
jgi:hypothetical protein